MIMIWRVLHLQIWIYFLNNKTQIEQVIFKIAFGIGVPLRSFYSNFDNWR